MVRTQTSAERFTREQIAEPSLACTETPCYRVTDQCYVGLSRGDRKPAGALLWGRRPSAWAPTANAPYKLLHNARKS